VGSVKIGLNLREALDALLAGKRVCREGWIHKRLQLFTSYDPAYMTETMRARIAEYDTTVDPPRVVGVVIGVVFDQSLVFPWDPRHADLFAMDWRIVAE